jgi:hypothetical protein
VPCDVNSSPFFLGRVIEKVSAALQVNGRQFVLRPMFKALSKFGCCYDELRSAIGILRSLVSIEIYSSRTPVKYLALGATLSFTDNFSNSGPAEYDVVTPALVLSARIAF